LRESLKAMPVPEPRRDFEDRVMAHATNRAAATAAPGRRAVLRTSATWWAGLGGALAASLVWAMLWFMRGGAPAQTRVVLALNESREVPLVIDSERELTNATIRLYVSGSIALAGYEEQHEIEWLTTLNRGANLLSLPVIAREPGEGLVVAEIEHGGRKRRVTVAMHVSESGRTTLAPRAGSNKDDIA
jgi:hypothetical protein